MPTIAPPILTCTVAHIIDKSACDLYKISAVEFFDEEGVPISDRRMQKAIVMEDPFHNPTNTGESDAAFNLEMS